jgi:drug/metabolite transporter (DMT)-like permease
MFALPVDNARMEDWFIVVYLGVFQIALAYWLITTGVRHVPALQASLLLLVEPVFSPIWVWLLLREQPGALALAGGVVVVVATAIYARQQDRKAGEVVATMPPSNGPVLDAD